MRLVAVRETVEGERRVAITPESSKGLRKLGVDLVLESGAGNASNFDDSSYEAEGVTIASDREVALREADCWYFVNTPRKTDLELLQANTVLVGFLRPFDDLDLVQTLANSSLTTFALELLPRTTRAQVMDALSSQASIAGYRAAILAAASLAKVSPMMTTPAGTIPPARVLVIGAGVAGLQAIATAGRLGARVEAYDTRPAVKEQVESLGARFMELNLDSSDSETSGGYAKAQTEDFLNQQRELLTSRLADFDIVITTALVPGQAAPVLVPQSAVDTMRRGSVIVDLAAANGGNCEVSVPNERIEYNGISVFGPTNLPSDLAPDASRMFSRNLLNFSKLIIDSDGNLNLDLEDEIVAGAMLTHDGKIVSEAVRKKLERS